MSPGAHVAPGAGDVPAAGPLDWFIFAIIVAVGGSSFAMIRGAVETVPPAVVSVGRLWVGAIFLIAVMAQAGRRFPPLTRNRALASEWRWIIALSLVGYVIPFLIFPWAQQFIASGLAGVYMAFMPIWTVLLAYFFADEALTLKKTVGFLLGFVGVLVLMGPDILTGLRTSGFLAQVSLLVATLGYAAAAVLTRRAPDIRPRVFSAGALLCAAIFTTPILFVTDLDVDAWTPSGVLNVIGLGLGPTGLAGILLIIMIRRVGAGFVGLANYLTPVWAVLMGAAIFGEPLTARLIGALALILAGVAIAQHRNGSRSR